MSSAWDFYTYCYDRIHDKKKKTKKFWLTVCEKSIHRGEEDTEMGSSVEAGACSDFLLLGATRNLRT